MPASTWWIDEPLLMGGSSPSGEDLRRFRSEGFSFAVSLLEERKQPPKYDQEAASHTGWSIYSLPIEEGRAPSVDQIRAFMTHLEALPLRTRVVVFCESGLGRTAFMGALYWVNKGVSCSDAIIRITKACSASDWATADRRRVLEEYERVSS